MLLHGRCCPCMAPSQHKTSPMGHKPARQQHRTAQQLNCSGRLQRLARAAQTRCQTAQRLRSPGGLTGSGPLRHPSRPVPGEVPYRLLGSRFEGAMCPDPWWSW